MPWGISRAAANPVDVKAQAGPWRHHRQERRSRPLIEQAANPNCDSERTGGDWGCRRRSHEEEHLPMRWVTPQMERKSRGHSGGRGCGRKPALRAKRPPAQLHAAAGTLSTSLPAVNGEEIVNFAN